MTALCDRSILLCVDGSHVIGLGHIYRMKSLALALHEAGDKVSFLTLADLTADDVLTWEDIC